jgi:membrane-associated phospholipid phosphatase
MTQVGIYNSLQHKPASRACSHWLKEIFIFFLAAGAWAGMALLRRHLTVPQCTLRLCSEAELWPFDAWVIHQAKGWADAASFQTQYAAAVLALLLITLPHWKSATRSLAGWSANLLLLLQLTGWNGAMTDLSRLIVQRPRPFVYLSPETLGLDTGHYTSFLSGHTTFSTGILVAAYLLVRSQPKLRVLGWVALATLPAATALFRVLAGRHFVSDVVVSACAGALAAWAYLRLRKTETPHE